MKNPHELARFLRAWSTEDTNGLGEVGHEERAEFLKEARKGKRREENIPLVKRVRVKREPFFDLWVWILIVASLVLTGLLVWGPRP